MTTMDPTTTLGDLVTAHPHLAREFESLGLDYCCGGQRTLADACVARGLDPEVTASELVDAVTDEPAPDWSTMGLAELVDHLESTHHRYLWNELPRLSALVAKIASVHGARHPELAQVGACFEEIRHDLEPHLVKEEQVLFPMIRELDAATEAVSFRCGTLRNPISVMLREHDTVGDLLARLRQLTDSYQPPADGCASYVSCYAGLAELEADTHLHIHKENTLLVPGVVRIESELAAASRTS
jgi:regulator of cell morphogenesis and NO signaling